jgi:hypothetical protein
VNNVTPSTVSNSRMCQLSVGWVVAMRVAAADLA